MTQLFARIRMMSHVAVAIFTLVVLSISANLASIFLPHIQADFTIYSLVVTAGTLLILALLTSYSQPRTELFFLILLAIGWVAEAAWVTDIIGYVQCDMISSESKTVTAKGSISARSYCYQMKTIEAFSWANFALFTIFAILLIALASRAHSLGRPFIWAEPIAEIPWFGEYPGYEGGQESENGESRPVSMRFDPRDPRFQNPMMFNGGFYPGMQPGQAQYQQGIPGYPNGGLVIQQQPGHSVVIAQGPNGQPQVMQVPGHVQQQA